VSHPAERYQDPETAKDLRAAVQARHELGPEMEDHVLEAFLARIETRVQAQVARQVKEIAKPGKKNSDYKPVAIIPATFGILVPLIAVAGIFGGSTAVLAVVAMVGLVNLVLYFDPRDRF
jgi:alkyl hydroperoxide reductase subunit AhpF